jgi:hypothetical protein
MTLKQKNYYYQIGIFYGKYRLSLFSRPVTREGIGKPKFSFDEFGRILILSSDPNDDKSAILFKTVLQDFRKILQKNFVLLEENIVEK